MNQNFSKFQAIVLGICILIGIGGVLLFATYKNEGSDTLPAVTIWGTVRSSVFNSFVSELNLTRDRSLAITYIEKNPATLGTEYTEALAVGRSPDLLLVEETFFLGNREKLLTIPYESIPLRIFRETFIEGAEMFTNNSGVIGIPFSVDPLIMFWNRDLFSREGIASYPKTWDEVVAIAPRLTRKDDRGNISISALPFGEWRNVTNAKTILSMLFMQAGTPIIAYDEGEPIAVLDESYGAAILPGEATLRFYTEFANPSKNEYSWNRSLTESKTAFVGGDLAMYFGYGSEIADIRSKAPQLNFDIAAVPQIRDTTRKLTSGRFIAFAIPRGATNPNGSYAVAEVLTSKEALELWKEITLLSVPRRDMLGSSASDPYASVIAESAFMTRSFLDPNPNATTGIFSSMVENVISGRELPIDAIRRGNAELERLIVK